MGYIQDPNDPNKQVPAPLSSTGHHAKPASYADTPRIVTVAKNPQYVLVNQTGSYYFNYDCGTTAVGATAPSSFNLGVKIHDAGAGIPVKLDISPCAWSASREEANATPVNLTGDVTFIYKGL